MRMNKNVTRSLVPEKISRRVGKCIRIHIFLRVVHPSKLRASVILRFFSIQRSRHHILDPRIFLDLTKLVTHFLSFNCAHNFKNICRFAFVNCFSLWICHKDGSTVSRKSKIRDNPIVCTYIKLYIQMKYISVLF